MAELFFQLYNASREPVFVAMGSGQAFWILSQQHLRSNVVYVAHLTEDDNVYYEEVCTKEVSWTSPVDKMSPAAAETVGLLVSYDRALTEAWIDMPFPEELSEKVMLQLDSILLEFEGGADETSAVEDATVGEEETVGGAEDLVTPATHSSGQSPVSESGSGSEEISEAGEAGEAGEASRGSPQSASLARSDLSKIFKRPTLPDSVGSGSGNGSKSGSGGDVQMSDDPLSPMVGPDKKRAGLSNPSRRPSILLTPALQKIASVTPEVLLRQNVIQSGTVMLLPRGAFGTWKKRHVRLRPDHLAYYDTEDSAEALGEIQITSFVNLTYIEYKRSKGIKLVSGSDAVSMAFRSEDEQELWFQMVTFAIMQSDKILRASVLLLPREAAEHFSALGSSEDSLYNSKRRTVILWDRVLTCHPDERSTSKIDSFFSVEGRVQASYHDTSCTIVLRDPVVAIAGAHCMDVIVLQFSAARGIRSLLGKGEEDVQYNCWKAELIRLLPGSAPAGSPDTLDQSNSVGQTAFRADGEQGVKTGPEAEVSTILPNRRHSVQRRAEGVTNVTAAGARSPVCGEVGTLDQDSFGNYQTEATIIESEHSEHSLSSGRSRSEGSHDSGFGDGPELTSAKATLPAPSPTVEAGVEQWKEESGEQMAPVSYNHSFQPIHRVTRRPTALDIDLSSGAHRGSMVADEGDDNWRMEMEMKVGGEEQDNWMEEGQEGQGGEVGGGWGEPVGRHMHTSMHSRGSWQGVVVEVQSSTPDLTPLSAPFPTPEQAPAVPVHAPVYAPVPIAPPAAPVALMAMPSTVPFSSTAPAPAPALKPPAPLPPARTVTVPEINPSGTFNRRSSAVNDHSHENGTYDGNESYGPTCESNESPLSEDSMTPRELRRTLQIIESELIIGPGLLLKSLKTKAQTPLGKVVFDRYKSTLLSIDPLSIQELCYDYGHYVDLQGVVRGVAKYASLPRSVMIYHDFAIWWSNNTQFSDMRLDDPDLCRTNSAVLCFRRFDEGMQGCVPCSCLEMLHLMLAQNGVISSRSQAEAVAALGSAAEEDSLHLAAFLQWLAAQESPDAENQSPMQRLFGEVARRSSSVRWKSSYDVMIEGIVRRASVAYMGEAKIEAQAQVEAQAQAQDEGHVSASSLSRKSLSATPPSAQTTLQTQLGPVFDGSGDSRDEADATGAQTEADAEAGGPHEQGGQGRTRHLTRLKTAFAAQSFARRTGHEKAVPHVPLAAQKRMSIGGIGGVGGVGKAEAGEVMARRNSSIPPVSATAPTALLLSVLPPLSPAPGPPLPVQRSAFGGAGPVSESGANSTPYPRTRPSVSPSPSALRSGPSPDRALTSGAVQFAGEDLGSPAPVPAPPRAQTRDSRASGVFLSTLISDSDNSLGSGGDNIQGTSRAIEGGSTMSNLDPEGGFTNSVLRASARQMMRSGSGGRSSEVAVGVQAQTARQQQYQQRYSQEAEEERGWEREHPVSGLGGMRPQAVRDLGQQEEDEAGDEGGESRAEYGEGYPSGDGGAVGVWGLDTGDSSGSEAEAGSAFAVQYALNSRVGAASAPAHIPAPAPAPTPAPAPAPTPGPAPVLVVAVQVKAGTGSAGNGGNALAVSRRRRGDGVRAHSEEVKEQSPPSSAAQAHQVLQTSPAFKPPPPPAPPASPAPALVPAAPALVSAQNSPAEAATAAKATDPQGGFSPTRVVQVARLPSHFQPQFQPQDQSQQQHQPPQPYPEHQSQQQPQPYHQHQTQPFPQTQPQYQPQPQPQLQPPYPQPQPQHQFQPHAASIAAQAPFPTIPPTAPSASASPFTTHTAHTAYASYASHTCGTPMGGTDASVQEGQWEEKAAFSPTQTQTQTAQVLAPERAIAEVVTAADSAFRDLQGLVQGLKAQPALEHEEEEASLAELLRDQFREAHDLVSVSGAGAGVGRGASRLDSFQQLMRERQAIEAALQHLHRLEVLSRQRTRAAEAEAVLRVALAGAAVLGRVSLDLEGLRTLAEQIRRAQAEAQAEAQVVAVARGELRREAKELGEQRAQELALIQQAQGRMALEEEIRVLESERRLSEQQLHQLHLQHAMDATSPPSAQSHLTSQALSSLVPLAQGREQGQGMQREMNVSPQGQQYSQQYSPPRDNGQQWQQGQQQQEQQQQYHGQLQEQQQQQQQGQQQWQQQQQQQSQQQGQQQQQQ
ncbi:hypothetical protein B484DRAFT_450772, partial [Ochromonadaceae sp. CCMP2298]